MKEKKQQLLGFYSYTVILTYVSLVVAIFGITQAIQENFRIAILCLAVSGLCDMFDGKIARTKKDRTEDEKRFGIQIDSLCDVICFGVFPIVICYCIGMKTPVGIGVLAVYGVASVIRLAYFNVTEERRQQETTEVREYYQGLPITSMAIILPFMYLIRRYWGTHFVFSLHIAVVIVGVLFISNIKVKKPQNPAVMILVAVIGLALAKMFHLF